MISSSFAMGFCFAEKNQHNKLLNQCAISSNGANDDYIRKIKSGARFKFQAGDVIELTLDMGRRELVCEKKPNGRCVLEVDALTNPYDSCHGYVVILKEGDKVEIV